jgi:methylated-DNA-protein-cysteine methyltransferase related protein
MKPLSEFSKKVIGLIKKIPEGKVATYGQIAKLAGKPQGSRGVAWILHSSSKTHSLPWQRVLGSKGKISFPPSSSHYSRQMRLLKKEGVVFGDQDQIDLAKYQWKKKVNVAKDGRLPRMFRD